MKERPKVRWFGVYYVGSETPAAMFLSKANAEAWCAAANTPGDHEPAPGWTGYEVRETRALGVKPLG